MAIIYYFQKKFTIVIISLLIEIARILKFKIFGKAKYLDQSYRLMSNFVILRVNWYM